MFTGGTIWLLVLTHGHVWDKDMLSLLNSLFGSGFVRGPGRPPGEWPQTPWSD